MEPYPKPKLTESTTWISEDLLPGVLKGLPVKSLCRFRCVCKYWNSLITSPFLINLHHSVSCSSTTTPPHLKPYLQIPYFRTIHSFRYYDHYALCSGILTNPSGRHLTHDLHFPFQIGEVTRSSFTHAEVGFHPTFVGVVRGVVCLTFTLESSFDYTVLWNPAIHKYLPLPCLTLPSHLQASIAEFAHVDHYAGTVRFDSHAIGFGYDTSKDDFKVVRLWIPPCDVYPICPPLPPVYEVYSPRQGLWRVAVAHIIQPCTLDCSKSRIGCFVNGAIHWLLSKFRSICNDYVLKFDCEREEFTRVELPPELRPPEEVNNKINIIELLEYGGMLCALSKPYWEDNCMNMWGMEEHGSWKKLFRIDTSEYNVIHSYQPSLDMLSPYGPSQWADFFSRPEFSFEQILSGRVYEETMFLMDDTKANSYAEDEIVRLQVTPAHQTCPKGMEDADFGYKSDGSSEEQYLYFPPV